MRVAHRGILLAFALLMLPAVAMAQEHLEEARQEFEQAETEFGRENFALALRGFERSYELLEGHPRRPLVLYNIGRCYEELNRYQEARDAYARYLRDAGDGAPQREETEARVRELETRVSMDAAATGGAPPDSDGASPSDTGGISPVGPIVLGVGGAMLVAGAILGGVTLANRGDLTAMCGADMRCPPDTRGLADDVSTLALTTDVLLFGGAAAAATGLILTLVLHDAGDTPTAALTCSQVGCMAFLQGDLD